MLSRTYWSASLDEEKSVPKALVFLSEPETHRFVAIDRLISNGLGTKRI